MLQLSASLHTGVPHVLLWGFPTYMLYTIFIFLVHATLVVHLTLLWRICIYVEYQSKLSYTLHILTVKLPLNRLLWNLILDDITKLWNHFNFHVDWRVLMTTLHEDMFDLNACLFTSHFCTHVSSSLLCACIFTSVLYMCSHANCAHMPSSYHAQLLCCCFDTGSHKLRAASNL